MERSGRSVYNAAPADALQGSDQRDDRLLSQTVMGQFADEDVEARELPALLEALLLAAPGMVTVAELAAAAEFTSAAVEDALEQMSRAAGRGWVLQRHGARVQLATDPRFADHVRRLLGFEREARLSAAALETLAIVAYQQPITRTAIEAVRGVDCSAVLSTLLNRGLIDSVSRMDLPGQPYEYSTTPAFLQHFGIRTLADLPPLPGVDGTNLAELLDETVLESQRLKPALEMVGATVGAVSGHAQLSDS